jgi:hypothetical protein
MASVWGPNPALYSTSLAKQRPTPSWLAVGPPGLLRFFTYKFLGNMGEREILPALSHMGHSKTSQRGLASRTAGKIKIKKQKYLVHDEKDNKSRWQNLKVNSTISARGEKLLIWHYCQ